MFSEDNHLWINTFICFYILMCLDGIMYLCVVTYSTHIINVNVTLFDVGIIYVFANMYLSSHVIWLV